MLDILSSLPVMDMVQVLAKTADDFCGDTGNIWHFIGQVVKILQIVIPVLIILLGTIDLGKAVIAGEDKKIKEAQKALISRIIYGVVIYFVVTIVIVIFGMVGANTGSNCFNCVAGRSSCKTTGVS